MPNLWWTDDDSLAGSDPLTSASTVADGPTASYALRRIGGNNERECAPDRMSTSMARSPKSYEIDGVVSGTN